ncbi:putative multiple sugar transport system substrate-binding protein [Glycomyces sambucus]|uniref:Putative multiple sugar transport system substrate-binding protein n=1 Tax=Glycomyces sambucus TaxID=380244 RepID=A0A1G9DR92_9ACTN|nr:putative multiple sugar transport system substrate-binding protein [Glycomyces sambucus]
MYLSRRGLLYGSAGVAAVSLAGCGVGGDDGPELTGFTGISMPTDTSERWVIEGKALEDNLKGLGYDVIHHNAKDVVEDQISQIQSMVDEGVEFLIIAAIDNKSLGQVLADAKDKGVIVISYDRLILETPDVDYYASFNNYQVGVLQANHIIDRLGMRENPGPFNVEIFSGDLGDNNSQYFFMGGLDTFESFIYDGKIVIPSGQTEQSPTSTAGWSGDVAMERMNTLLADFYDDLELHAVLSPYDGISRGVVQALVDADYEPGTDDFPVVTGQDAEAASIKAIKDGTGQTETVFKDTRLLASTVTDMVEALVGGGEPEVNDLGTYDNGFKFVPSLLLDPVDVTAENYVEVIVESEYLTEEQIDAGEALSERPRRTGVTAPSRSERGRVPSGPGRAAFA